MTPDWDINYGTELYDHQKDPQENRNVYNLPEYTSAVTKLSAILRAGWRDASIVTQTTGSSTISSQIGIISGNLNQSSFTIFSAGIVLIGVGLAILREKFITANQSYSYDDLLKDSIEYQQLL